MLSSHRRHTTKVVPGLGKRIAARRLERGLSQETVSRRAGIHASYLSRIETGKVQPTVRTALRVAAAMDVSPNDLFGPTPPDRPCPVSGGGQCLAELIEARPHSGGGSRAETYTPRQIRLLRRFVALVRESRPNVLTALELLIPELLGEENEKPG